MYIYFKRYTIWRYSMGGVVWNRAEGWMLQLGKNLLKMMHFLKAKAVCEWNYFPNETVAPPSGSPGGGYSWVPGLSRSLSSIPGALIPGLLSYGLWSSGREVCLGFACHHHQVTVWYCFPPRSGSNKIKRKQVPVPERQACLNFHSPSSHWEW